LALSQAFSRTPVPTTADANKKSRRDFGDAMGFLPDIHDICLTKDLVLGLSRTPHQSVHEKEPFSTELHASILDGGLSL
jgi:hypothetical protein